MLHPPTIALQPLFDKIQLFIPPPITSIPSVAAVILVLQIQFPVPPPIKEPLELPSIEFNLPPPIVLFLPNDVIVWDSPNK